MLTWLSLNGVTAYPFHLPEGAVGVGFHLGAGGRGWKKGAFGIPTSSGRVSNSG